MAEIFSLSQNTPTRVLKDELTTPQLFLSSEGSGWEGVTVYAFHEPSEFDGWLESSIPDLSLMLMTRGAWHIESRSSNGPWTGHRIHQGDLTLIPGGSEPEELRWQSLSPSEPLQTLSIQLDQHLLARTAEEMTGHDLACLSLNRHTGFQDPLLTQIGLALYQELEQQHSAGKLYAQIAAQMLAVHLLHHYTSIKDERKEPSQGLTRRQMKRVNDFILVHLSQDLSLDVLAEQAGFSSYHFTRLFRQTTGESPHQFVTRQRIEQAQSLLKQTDVPLAQVALEVGFSNQSHFTRVFKQHLGLTPRRYRQVFQMSAHFEQDSQE